MTATAKLGGVTLNYGVGWEIRAGVEPVQRQFVMSTDRANAILKRGQKQLAGNDQAKTRSRKEQNQTGPLEFSIAAPGLKPLVVKGLYAIEVQPVDDVLSSVLVADARWLLKRKHITREYNTRRRTGINRFVQGVKTPIQVNKEVPDYTFKRVTMKNGVRWTAREVLEDVMGLLVGSNYTIGNLNLTVDIEGLSLDDPGDAALSRVLAYLPGAGVFVDKNGVYRVFNTLDQSEALAVKKVKDSGRKWWGDTVSLIDKSLVRPTSVVSFFEEEIELRFDYEEIPETQQPPTQVRGFETRGIENVIAVADPKVTLNGDVYARGSWLRVNDWINATQAQRAIDGDVNLAEYPFTQRLFLEHALTGFRIPRLVLVAMNKNTQSPVHDQRFNAIQTHWRKTFRIASRYMDKLNSIRAVRASVLDQETGTRARADAFADYVLRPTRRGLVKKRNETTQAAYNFSSYADDISSAAPSPVDVQVLDPEVGVFRLNFVIDPFGEGERIEPGNLDDRGSAAGGGVIPSWNMSTAAGLEAQYVAWNHPLVKLSPTYKVAVVLTVSRAAPNDTSRYHAESVSAASAASVLPGVGKVGRSLGPSWAIKIGPSIETARYAWVDSKSAEIDAAVWSGAALDSGLLVNPTHLDAVAKATAARVYAMLLDRHEGSMSLSLDPSVEPTGSLKSVLHKLDTGGRASTTMVMPPISIPIDIWALLPDSSRKILQRQVQQ